MVDEIRVGILGASGYTGADAVRLAARHPHVRIVALTANTHAGKPMSEVFPHTAGLSLPELVKWENTDWTNVDAVICGLPHGTTQEITATVLGANPNVRILDMSADFRLRDIETYAHVYGQEHRATSLQAEAVYGLTEHNREAIASARLVACPGCYPTAVLLALLPLVASSLIDADDIIIDAKSGVSGAGRSLRQSTLFCEAGEGLSPYSVGVHRHAPEIEQEIAKAAGRAVRVNFTPHLVPMSRGEMCTHHVRLASGATPDDIRAVLSEAYSGEPFVRVLPEGGIPRTQNVRGSNFAEIAVFGDRIAGRAVVISAIDNLVKGSAGQALQNLNVVFGLDETIGLAQLPLFP